MWRLSTVLMWQPAAAARLCTAAAPAPILTVWSFLRLRRNPQHRGGGACPPSPHLGEGRGGRGEGIVVVGGREFRVSVFILCFKPFCFWFTFYYEGDFPLDRWCHGVWTEGVEVSPRHVIWTAVYQQLQVQGGVQLEPGGSRIFIFT